MGNNIANDVTVINGAVMCIYHAISSFFYYELLLQIMILPRNPLKLLITH